MRQLYRWMIFKRRPYCRTEAEGPVESARRAKSYGVRMFRGHRIVVVASTGIFRRRIRWCQCPGSADTHIQLLHSNLFSATIKRPSTAFTFDVLDHFHIDAMECKTAALNFYNKLRRLTSNAFPGTAPVSVLFQVEWSRH
jgi:hypothetical protein